MQNCKTGKDGYLWWLMLKTRKKMQKIEIFEGIVCDRCGRTASHKDAEYKEFLQIGRRGGYGSIIGDGTDWSLDVCQHCLVDVFGKYIRLYDEEKNQAIWAEVLKRAIQVFESEEKASLWLNSPNVSLGDIRPIDLLSSSAGVDQVLDALARIEYGVFS
jgi:hypothetical protein